jgi:hypothetical protein
MAPIGSLRCQGIGGGGAAGSTKPATGVNGAWYGD